MNKQVAARTIAHKFSDVAYAYKRTAHAYIISAYGEAHRFYHDETHIAGMLELLDRYGAIATRPDVIAHAILWHDAVYLTRDTDGQSRPDAVNVKDSAEAFRAHIHDMHDKDQNAVSAMIMATSGHQTPQTDGVHYKGFAQDTGLFLDFDLSGLALPWEEFWDNTKAIRKEYDWVDKDLFCHTRADILQKFAEHETLYHVVPDRKAWDDKARINIERSIQKLRNLEL